MNASFATTSAVREVAAHLLAGHRRATKYLTPKFVVKGARCHKPRSNEGAVTIVITVGAPNYAEREFIKIAKKAKLVFPVRKIQLKAWK